MKTMIFTLMAMFIWTMMPIEAIADKGDRTANHNRQTSRNYEQNRYDRHGERHDRYEKRRIIKREHRKHRRQVQSQRVEHRYRTPQVRQTQYRDYRTYIIPSGYVYTSTPGVSLYFSW
jgi:Ni/Co efflux regulator RcnB